MLDIITEGLSLFVPYLPTELTDRTYIEGAGLDEVRAPYEVELGTTTPDVDVEEGLLLLPRECSDEIRGDELSLLSAVDDLDLDPRLLIDLVYELHPILCISHRRGSTGSEGFYLVDLHQFMVGLHEADELLGLLP